MDALEQLGETNKCDLLSFLNYLKLQSQEGGKFLIEKKGFT